MTEFAFSTNSVGDIMNDDLGEYFTDPYKHNYFSEIWTKDA